jgi:hypothetical protein
MTFEKGDIGSARPWIPTAWMQRAMRFLLEQGGAGLFLDPG